MVDVLEAVVVFFFVVVVLGLVVVVVVVVFGVASATVAFLTSTLSSVPALVVFAVESVFDSGFASETMATALRTSSLGSSGFASDLGAGFSTAAGFVSSAALEAATMTGFGSFGTRPGAWPYP